MMKNYTKNLLPVLKPKLRYVLGCCLLFTASHTFAQNDPWTVYDANVLPDQTENNKFVTSNVSPSISASVPAIYEVEQSIITDPNNGGNKLLSFLINGNPHNSFLWRQNLPSTPSRPTDATFVVRAKGKEGVDRAFELDMDFGDVRETVYINNNGTFTFNIAKGNTQNAAIKTTIENALLNINVLEWHTYRVTRSGNVTSLYVDENPTPVASATSYTAVTVSNGNPVNYFRFGDGHSTVTYGSDIDYILWTVEGAYSPAQKALPAGTVTKLASAEAAAAKLSVYPNPVKGGQAKLSFHLQSASDVSVQVFDLAGRKVGEAVTFSNMRAGQNEVSLPVTGLKEGAYLYQISTNRFTTTQKVFVK